MLPQEADNYFNFADLFLPGFPGPQIDAHVITLLH
ncbi:hypothetical protein JOF45_002015 [Nesterenkonia lacusekhoensis]|uniref:Uncharacterized protein n=1 Tax=Nesterenkonia lacusekhoensis TaxID=150832 RepID=A0ABS4T3I0_9MICC|nr:hypothetical protein [Nesterenkonia lacusekhoensis]